MVAVVGIGVIIIVAIILAHVAQVRRTGKMPPRDEFNVSVAQDAGADGAAWQSLTLAVSAVSSDAAYIDAMLAEVVEFLVSSRPDLELLDYGSEIISGV